MAESEKVVPLKPVAKETAKTAKKATKKTTTKSNAKKKAPAKKTAAKKSAPKTATKTKAKAAKAKETKKTVKKAVKKAAPKKTTAKKSEVKKPQVKKSQAKKTTGSKAKAAKKTTSASKKVQKQTITKLTEKLIMQQPNFDTKNFEQAQAQFDQFSKEAANLNREGIDAFVKSGTIFAKGFENLVRESITLTQSAAEKQMQLAKDAMTSKTINEFSEAQNKLAQVSFDDFMSGTTKITELGVKVMSEAIEPINDQIQKSVQKATDAVAAE